MHDLTSCNAKPCLVNKIQLNYKTKFLIKQYYTCPEEYTDITWTNKFAEPTAHAGGASITSTFFWSMIIQIILKNVYSWAVFKYQISLAKHQAKKESGD